MTDIINEGPQPKRGITDAEMQHLANLVSRSDTVELERLARSIAGRDSFTKEMVSELLRTLGVTVRERPHSGLSEGDMQGILMATKNFRLADQKRRDELPLEVFDIDMSNLYDPSCLGASIELIDPELKEHFTAHGINKGGVHNDRGDLESLNQWLIQDGPDQSREFTQVPLSIGGQYKVYGTGGFVLIGPYDRGLHDGIGLVVVNRQYRDARSIFQRRFPNVRFVFVSEDIRASAEEINQQLRNLREESREF